MSDMTPIGDIDGPPRYRVKATGVQDAFDKVRAHITADGTMPPERMVINEHFPGIYIVECFAIWQTSGPPIGDDSCETCKFWRLSVSSPLETDSNVKECRCKAPMPAYPQYPRTVAADWCGEYKGGFHALDELPAPRPQSPPPDPSEGGLYP